MREKCMLGALLMFLFTIGFVSCDNDDNDNENEKLPYDLELSQNTCEMKQGGSAVIDLISHENTTLDIKNPELIDAVYTWGLDGYKAKIEIKGKQKGETEILVTNHETGKSATITVTVTEFPMPRLAVEQPKGNIYDMMNFYLYREDSASIKNGELSAVCDSIVWTVEGIPGSFRVFEHKEIGVSLSMTWGHCFKYSGEFKTNLTAWKDNEPISRSELDITITNDKDFLAYNWSGITEDSQEWTAYADVLTPNVDLMTTYGIRGEVPFVTVKIFNSDTGQNDYTIYDYISTLYSDPTYTDKVEKDKMSQLYDELFSEQKEYSDAYPVAIWKTERANIVLLLLDESRESPGYIVYAEPYL